MAEWTDFVGTPGLVAYDATPLEGPRSGVGQYTRHLLGALVARGDGRRYALLAGRVLNGQVPAGTLGQVGGRLPNRALWMQMVVPRVLERLRPEVAHFTNSLAPLNAPCPLVVTLHDMSLFLHARTQPLKSLVLVRTLIPWIARRAAAIITVSHSARRDILAVLGLSPERVHVIYEAAGPAYRVLDPVADAADFARVRQRYGLDAPYALYVGTLEPRKNLTRLVRAFARARAAGRRERLVLAGRPGWKYRETLQAIEACGMADVVHLLGYVPDEDLPALYNAARAVVFPSLYEGFGLPVLEGMACGVPVLTSTCAALAEIAQGAARLVDPLDEEALAAELCAILGDTALRENLRAAGLARTQAFSWERAAEATARVYAQVAR